MGFQDVISQNGDFRANQNAERLHGDSSLSFLSRSFPLVLKAFMAWTNASDRTSH